MNGNIEFYGFLVPVAELLAAVSCLLVVFFSIKCLKSGGELSKMTPGLSISLGIFFTFLGLAVSLYVVSDEQSGKQFDALLAGLGVAFWSSVAGIGMSIYARVRLANTHEETLLDGFENQIDKIRTGITKIGGDIESQLTSKLNASVNHHVNIINQMMSESHKQLTQSNQLYLKSTENLNTTLNDISNNFCDIGQQLSAVLRESNTVSQNISNQFNQDAQLLAENTKWFDQIKNSVGSIASLAPEAKEVLSSINIINEYSLEFREKLSDERVTMQTQFGEDINRLTNNLVEAVRKIDTEYERAINDSISELNETLGSSLGVISNHFGGGIVALAKQKLSTIEDIVFQLSQVKDEMEKSKQYYIDQLVTDRQSDSNSSV